jgi:hypothetical protein
MVNDTLSAREYAIREIQALANLRISRREIARRTGLGQATVYGVIKGQHGISEARAGPVAESLRLSRIVTINFPDGSQVSGQPATTDSARTIGRYGTAVHQAQQGNPTALRSGEFRRSVTLIDRTGERRRVRLSTDEDWLEEMGERDEDVIDFSESESP